MAAITLVGAANCVSVPSEKLQFFTHWQPAAATAAEPDKADVKLAELNALFRGNYALAKQEIRKELGPIIFIAFNDMTLIYKGERTTETFIPDRYTYFKEVDHVPLACYVTLINKTNRKLNDDEIKAVEKLSEESQAAQKLIAARASGNKEQNQPETDRQLRLLSAAIDFLARVSKEREISHNQLRTFVRSVNADTIKNMQAATEAQLQEMQRITDKWRSKIPAEDWSRLHVIIASSHMPRHKLSGFQFFQNYLGEKVEGHKIIVMEGLTTEEEGLDLLATHILDGKIAVDYFAEPEIMHSDLLSGSARKWLKKHPVKPRR